MQEKILIKRILDGSRQAAESGRAGAYWSLEQIIPVKFVDGVIVIMKTGDRYCRMGKRCSFCNEVGHVETNGPRGSSLIQYFACQNFVEMTPAQRYQELRSKGKGRGIDPCALISG